MADESAERPRLRGVSHQWAFFVAVIAGGGLVARAPSPRAALAALGYAIALVALFGVSALYHRVTWNAVSRNRMKRLDHATIFVFIAGSYTPICLLALAPGVGQHLLVWAWIGAGLGVARSLLWPGAPRAIAAGLYVLLGWLSLTEFPAIAAGTGATGAALLALGGLLYSVGAVIYALRRPDPLPQVFGYHEVFHALVILACACHFVAIAGVVLQGR